MYKVVLWGLGEGYNSFIAHHGYEMVEVVAVADKDDCYYKTIDGIPIIKPEELIEYKDEIDYLIITMLNEQVTKEVTAQAVSMGIPRDIILPLRIFCIPFFDFDEYIEIKNSNISIISDFCFAGYLYHKFGFEFTSPTINMFATNENYYKFISNLAENMRLPMKKVENVVDNPLHGAWTYPRGVIGDCEWNFNHDVLFEEALDKWNRRVNRFNPENYIVIMYILSDEMGYKFDELPIKHKLGFYWKDLKLNSVLYMPQWHSPKVRAQFEYWFGHMITQSVRESNKARPINWIKFLAHKADFVRTN